MLARMDLPELIQDVELLSDAEQSLAKPEYAGAFLVVALDREGEPDPELEDESDAHDPQAYVEIGRCASLTAALRLVLAHPDCPVDDVDPEAANPQFWRALVHKQPALARLRTARYRNFASLQLLDPIERDQLADDDYLWCVEQAFAGFRLRLGWSAVPPLQEVAFAILEQRATKPRA